MTNKGSKSSDYPESLEDLVLRMETKSGPWWEDRSTRDNNIVTIDNWSDPLAIEALVFLYDNKLILDFDWGSWQEGRDFWGIEDESKYETLDKEYVLKLLTAVARNSRFNEGAWALLFQSGTAQKLFRRLLEIEKVEKSSS